MSDNAPRVSLTPVSGYDVLALARYCETYLAAPPLPGLSTLLKTFGNPLPCVERAIKLGIVSVVQVDLLDATCFRNRVCEGVQRKPTDYVHIYGRSRQVNKLAIKYPHIDWWVSPALEHDVRNCETVRQMMSAAQRGCPSCKVINSPFLGCRLEPLELHGTTLNIKAFSVSSDGKSVFDSNSVLFRSLGKRFIWYWWPELNLRTTGEKSFTPPSKRTVRPTSDQFTQAYLISLPPTKAPIAPPKRCSSTRSLYERELLKTNSEQYGNTRSPDIRGNKPLFIIAQHGKAGDRINIISPRGRVIGHFAYYGKFETKGLHRWYVGTGSKQTPVELYRAARGEWAFAEIGHRKCIPFNVIRRAGYFR